MAKDRARDTRRSVGSHEKMMGALGRAAGGWERSTLRGKDISEKVIEDTGELKGVRLGKGHVYHSGTNTPIDETNGLTTKAPFYSAYESADESFK